MSRSARSLFMALLVVNLSLLAAEPTPLVVRNLALHRDLALGLEVVKAGIRDLILPGEMKELLNKVTEAKKAAEANLITRREETAAIRSQANTAKLLQENPTLMRLRELEILEKIAASSDLKIVLGDKGLTERMVNLL